MTHTATTSITPDPGVLATYDALAPKYDARYANPAAHAEDRQVAAWLSSPTASVDRVLDIGCGTGLVAQLLADTPTHLYTGIDPSRGMLDQFALKFPTHANRLQHNTFGGWLASNMIYEHSFDLIVSTFGSPTYLSAGEVALIPSLLAPGGRALLMFYGPDHCPDYHAHRPATAERAREAGLALPRSRHIEWNNFTVVTVNG